MADGTGPVVYDSPPGRSDVASLNQKLQYDFSAQLQGQALLDNQENSRRWNAFAYKVAQDAADAQARRVKNAEAFDHAVNMDNVTQVQVGGTEAQQTVSPVRTATGDAIVGGVGVSAEQVAANVATFTTAISAAVLQFYAGMVAVNLTAAGGASTPSQTQAKPTA